jgi:hypothetical protein
MTQESIRKDYSDFYKHGDPERAEKFIGFLSRTKEVATKSTTIYNEYMSWCKNMGVIPVGLGKFRTLLREHGYKLEVIGSKIIYVNAEYRYSREDTTSKVAYLPKIKEVKRDENKLTEGSLCTHTDEPRIKLPEEEIPLEAVLSNESNEANKEEKVVKENNIEDLSKLTQIQMIELLQEAERQKFEQRMQKFEQLKEEIIEADFSNQEVLAKMQELL